MRVVEWADPTGASVAEKYQKNGHFSADNRMGVRYNFGCALSILPSGWDEEAGLGI